MALNIRLATRASPLAQIQAQQVADRLTRILGDGEGISLLPLITKGDQITDRHLRELGGKGLFTSELDRAIMNGAADLAVHSLKDIPNKLADDQEILAFIEREDPREVFISLKYKRFTDLSEGAVLGTASLRRQAQSLNKRPDLKIISFRGNVGTRLQKLARGEADATYLAVAGLKRLAMESKITQILSIEDMIPAPAQGIIAITGIRANLAPDILQAILELDHAPTRLAALAERAFLAELDGSCQTPIAGHFHWTDHYSGYFHGQLLSPDGKDSWYISKHISIAESDQDISKEMIRLGQSIGQAILQMRNG